MAEQLQELGEFKVGDQVVVTTNRGFNKYRYIAVIDKISSAYGGTIWVDKTRYDNRGWARGHTGYHPPRITPVTVELIEEVRGEQSRARLEHFKWHELSPKEANHYIHTLREAGLKI